MEKRELPTTTNPRQRKAAVNTAALSKFELTRSDQRMAELLCASNVQNGDDLLAKAEDIETAAKGIGDSAITPMMRHYAKLLREAAR